MSMFSSTGEIVMLILSAINAGLKTVWQWLEKGVN